MSCLSHVVNVRIAACALPALLLVTGCASLWTKKEDDSFSSRLASSASRSGVKQASAEEPTDEPKPLGWSDFSFNNLGKTSKRLTGQGEDHNLARQLYREGYDLFEQAKAADAHRKAD